MENKQGRGGIPEIGNSRNLLSAQGVEGGMLLSGQGQLMGAGVIVGEVVGLEL